MHVLIVPSQEFIPSPDHIAGIFQRHQARILESRGLKTGILSIRQDYSVPMIIRGAAARIGRQRVGNALDDQSLMEMFRLLRDKLARPHRFVRHDSVDGIPVVRISGFYYLPPSPRTNFFGWVRAGNVAYDAYVAAHGAPDLIHAHNLDAAGILAESIHHRTGIPYVVTEHSSYFERNLIPHGLYPRLARAARAASALMVVSPSLAGVLERELGLAPDEMTYVPNVIDPEFIDSPCHSRQSVRDGFTFFSLGNLIPVKDHALLLRAFHMAFANQAGVTLRLGGEGPMRGELERLAARLGLVPQISFLGPLRREGVITELDGCDAFVLPSRYETFGVVLIEALARGRPVITCASGGPQCIVTDADGEMVPPGDADELAAAMKRIVSRRGAYPPEGLRERAIRRFGPAAFLERLLPVYTAAVSM